MLNKPLRITLIAIACAFIIPATTVRAVPPAGECAVCKPGWNYDTNSPGQACGTPESGDWGSNSCHVDCFTYSGDFTICTCDDSANQCMYIVVQQ